MNEHEHGEQVDAYRRNDGRDDIGLDIPVKNTNAVLDALPASESGHSRVVKFVSGVSCGTMSLKPRVIK